MTNWTRLRLALSGTALLGALAPRRRAEDAAARELVQKVRDTAPKTPLRRQGEAEQRPRLRSRARPQAQAPERHRSQPHGVTARWT